MANICFHTAFAFLSGVALTLYIQNSILKKYLLKDTYMKTILENTPIIIYIKDLKGNILLCNREFSKATGLPRKTLENKNLSEIYTVDLMDTIKKEDSIVILEKKSAIFEKYTELGKGEFHWFSFIKSPVFDKKNNVIGIIVMCKNMDKEKEIDSHKNTFIATLTHDLKTPTLAQTKTLDMLLDGTFGELKPIQKEMIRLTCCSCHYLSDLVATILDTYSCDNGNLVLKPEDFNLTELAQSLCTGLENLALDKNQKIIFKSGSPACIITADRLQIKRVIMNFIANAITYGYKNTNIEVEIRKIEDSVELIVRNLSQQITENDLKLIFDKVKKSKIANFNKTSTGLGLYLSKQIIDMHGGEIYAKSGEDGTCTFGFIISVKNPAIVSSKV